MYLYCISNNLYQSLLYLQRVSHLYEPYKLYELNELHFPPLYLYRVSIVSPVSINSMNSTNSINSPRHPEVETLLVTGDKRAGVMRSVLNWLREGVS
jgi:hypothetical protein